MIERCRAAPSGYDDDRGGPRSRSVRRPRVGSGRGRVRTQRRLRTERVVRHVEPLESSGTRRRTRVSVPHHVRALGRRNVTIETDLDTRLPRTA